MRLVVLLFVVACGKKQSDCLAEANELSRFLTAMDHEPPIAGVEDIKLVARTDLPRTAMHEAPGIVIGPKSTMVDGRAVTTDQLGVELDKKRRFIESYPRLANEPRRVYIAVDEATPWQSVVSVVDTAHRAGFVKAAFAFARPASTPPPPRAPIDDDIDRIIKGGDPSDRASKIAKLTQETVKSCDELTGVFKSVAATEGDKADFILGAVGPALVGCNCKADLPAVRSLMWRIAGNPHPVNVIEVDLDPHANPLELPAATPWREASKHLSIHTVALNPLAS
jgi:hypothetical protein